MLKVIERIITEGEDHIAYIRVDLSQVPDAEVVEFNGNCFDVGESRDAVLVVNNKANTWTIRVDGEVVDTLTFPLKNQYTITLVVANVLPQAHIPMQPQPGRDRVQLIINGITVYTN